MQEAKKGLHTAKNDPKTIVATLPRHYAHGRRGKGQGKRRTTFKRQGRQQIEPNRSISKASCQAGPSAETESIPGLCSIAVQTLPAEAVPRRASFRRQRPERAPRSPEAAGGKIPAASRKRRFSPRRVRPENHEKWSNGRDRKMSQNRRRRGTRKKETERRRMEI